MFAGGLQRPGQEEVGAAESIVVTEGVLRRRFRDIQIAGGKVQADPPLLPQATLTNGQKTVVFQGMIHVGMEGFYKSVVYDLEEALNEGYRLYYEGVQPSPGEGDAWFDEQLAGGSDLADNYKVLALSLIHI